MSLKNTALLLVFLFTSLSLAVPAGAEDPATPAAPVAEQPLELAHADQPQPSVLTELQKERARIHAEFSRFAKTWVAMLNRNHRLSRSRMKAESSGDGFVAHYNLMDGDTIICQIRPTTSQSVPYLGILKYKERCFERTGGSAGDCLNGEFHQLPSIAHTEIFNYQNGRWN